MEINWNNLELNFNILYVEVAVIFASEFVTWCSLRIQSSQVVIYFKADMMSVCLSVC